MYKEPRPMREIHEIQEKIHEEMKNMTDRKKIEAIHREAEQAEKNMALI